MRRIATVAVAAVLLTTACESTTTGTPDQGAITTTVLALEGRGGGNKTIATISDSPVHVDAFAGWKAAADTDADDELPGAQPDTSYVVVTGSTGCRSPEGVAVHRDGADLTVDWVGGTEAPECAAGFYPVAHFAVESSAVAGVRRVNGVEPVAADGPATQSAFVPLGPIDTHDILPVSFADTEAMYQQLAARDAEYLDLVRTVLDRTFPRGTQAYAFVLSGCTEERSVLLISEEKMTAKLVGGDKDTACDAPMAFFVSFELPDRFRPENAVLTND